MLSRRTRIVLSILVVASLTFIILDLRGGDGPFSSARAAGSGILGGAQRVAATIFSPVTGFAEWWSTLNSQSSQIRTLREENAQLQAQVSAGANDRARAESLDSLLRVAGVGQYEIVPAEVIAVGPAQDFAWTVTIDAGSADGIEAEMTVINGDGLVGRVLKVYNQTSTVVLVVDASSAVGGRVATTEEIGIVAGTGRQDSLDFQLLDPLAELRVGDALVTFGSRGGRPYAPGLPIGEVVEVSGTAGQLTRIATVRPFADMSRLSVVGVVIRPPREDPRDSVLPDAPGRAASPQVDGTQDETAPAPPTEEAVEDAVVDEVPQVEQPATPAPEVAQ